MFDTMNIVLASS